MTTLRLRAARTKIVRCPKALENLHHALGRYRANSLPYVTAFVAFYRYQRNVSRLKCVGDIEKISIWPKEM